jgi:hypothetical protein
MIGPGEPRLKTCLEVTRSRHREPAQLQLRSVWPTQLQAARRFRSMRPTPAGPKSKSHAAARSGTEVGFIDSMTAG